MREMPMSATGMDVQPFMLFAHEKILCGNCAFLVIAHFIMDRTAINFFDRPQFCTCMLIHGIAALQLLLATTVRLAILPGALRDQ